MKMPQREKYIVNMREVWVQPVEVLATSKQEALSKVEDGGGVYLAEKLEYSHTLEKDYWDTEKKSE